MGMLLVIFHCVHPVTCQTSNTWGFRVQHTSPWNLNENLVTKYSSILEGILWLGIFSWLYDISKHSNTFWSISMREYIEWRYWKFHRNLEEKSLKYPQVLGWNPFRLISSKSDWIAHHSEQLWRWDYIEISTKFHSRFPRKDTRWDSELAKFVRVRGE